jgi:hypothetical protein
MQLTHRRLAPNELDHELIWLTVSLGSLGFAIIWFALGLPWPRCLFLALTGHPCITCGATRSTLEFFHGHFFAALRWNPLVFATLCALSIFDAYAFAVVITRAPRLRIAQLTSAEKNFVRAAVVIFLAVNWIYVLASGRDYS